jgi:hypothetical protein
LFFFVWFTTEMEDEIVITVSQDEVDEFLGEGVGEFWVNDSAVVVSGEGDASGSDLESELARYRQAPRSESEVKEVATPCRHKAGFATLKKRRQRANRRRRRESDFSAPPAEVTGPPSCEEAVLTAEMPGPEETGSSHPERAVPAGPPAETGALHSEGISRPGLSAWVLESLDDIRRTLGLPLSGLSSLLDHLGMDRVQRDRSWISHEVRRPRSPLDSERAC